MRVTRFFSLVMVFLVLLAGMAIAGYDVTCSVTESAGNYVYTWNVTNLDQGGGFRQGLDGFFVLVPSETTVVSYTVPPNYYPFPDFWGFSQITTGGYDSLGNMFLAPPPEGMKWLTWWGYGWDTIYPPGATATFSATIQNNTVPGTTDCAAVTWWGPPPTGSDTYTGYHYSITGPVLDPGPESKYQWCGFLPPLTANGNGLFKRGSTVPVKFRITDLEGKPVSNCIATLEVFYWTEGASEGTAQTVSYANGDTGDTFRYNALDDLYIFNLSTKPWEYLGNIRYQVVVTLDDGQKYDIYFSLK